MRCSLLIIAALGVVANAARLRASTAQAVTANTSVPSSFAALIELFGEKAVETGSIDDPHWMAVNKRLARFEIAVHHLAMAKVEHKSTQVAATKMSKKKEDAVGHEFEHIADDKTCAAGAGGIGVRKGVKAADDCKPLCAKEAGCVAFSFSYKPFKQCELFSECAEADANKIRKYSLYALKNDNGDIEDRATCGSLPKYPNSGPKGSKNDPEGMSAEPLAFVSGDEVPYKCARDTTIDGSKEGSTEFMVSCADQGYFQPGRHGCVQASECGAMPCTRKAHPTGKVTGDAKNPKIEMVCDDGYSLDGEKVVPGGALKNALLYMECDSVGRWTPVVDYLGKKGKACEPFAFVPASGMIKMYNKVFEVLFIASCNTEISKWAEMEEKMPPKLEDGTVCGENVADSKEGDCKSLVDDLKTLFDDAKGAGNAAIDAKPFCGDMWDLLKMDEPAAMTEC